ncbi:MAG: histidine--tRNA ligase [Thermoleophilaceae bacterium]
MAREKLKAPRGTFDVLPDAGRARLELMGRFAETFARFGYGPAETPIFESTELFARGVGETTDIVQKEMFTFEDQGGRSMTLRPEGTAGVARAYIEHGMHRLPQPVKLWYWGPFFRYEAPQAGRFRQFNQVGAEAIGSDDPSLDVEVILLLAELLRAAGVESARLRLSSLGTPETRSAYSQALRDYLRPREEQLAPDVRARLDQNPLRAFDSEHAGTRAALEGAPKLLDSLSPEDADHFADVRALLDSAGQPYETDRGLVRGLDYYSRTVFEFTSDALGAQSGVGGGGRYDGLIGQLGGPQTPAVGFAAGIERILLAGKRQASSLIPDAYVAVMDGASRASAFLLTRDLIGAGLSAQLEQGGRSVKGQLKHADRLGARVVVKVSSGDFVVRDMASGEERSVADRAAAVRLVSGLKD